MESQATTPTTGCRDQPHLGNSINVATRALHAKLNRNILQLFPLALPPHTDSPSVYVTGLLHIAPVYLTFESLWQDILTADPDPPQTDTLTKDHPSNHPSPPNRIPILLRLIHLVSLTRSAALLNDIATITGWTEAAIHARLAVLCSQRHQQQPREAHGQPKNHLPAFLTHIRQAVTARPHALLAYAWVLYMALFSGGRVLRGVLEDVGGEFWGAGCRFAVEFGSDFGSGFNSDPAGWRRFGDVSGGVGVREEEKGEDEEEQRLLPGGGGVRGVVGDEIGKSPSPSPSPLGFFRFETPLDREEVKVEFKRRFGEAGRGLTAEERAEVVAEAGRVFEGMVVLVEQLEGRFKKSREGSPGKYGGSVGGRWVSKIAGLPLRGWVRGGRTVDKEGVEVKGMTGEGGSRGSKVAFGVWCMLSASLMAGVGLGLRYAWA